ncbi:unnamed protein product [Miscanthus lutarioriparius]|uniref:MORF/ORRM1/DAG-like MORF domain-containing protein n=1 Tax=Miscanthus lutarioriparius TaxID=422564 RepID=A0A811SFZ2_9POAL|nr:unnamed protein product [Miscanthus lutarioriparius]
MPEVSSVQPDKGNKSEKDNHSLSLSTANLVSISDGASNSSSSSGKNEFWLVRMEKPGVEVLTKAQMVDHYTRILMKALWWIHRLVKILSSYAGIQAGVPTK